jgi:hypothetical protein
MWLLPADTLTAPLKAALTLRGTRCPSAVDA